MTRFFSKLALPLLAKELTERAARKRTYIGRVIFAVLLMGAFGMLLAQFSRYNYGPFVVLGNGGIFFQGVILFQAAGIFLFLPAMTAGQITFEKERDSLALLFLTRLGPWQIVIEKYLSALISIFSLLLLAMPMGAIAYAYGGVTQWDVGLSIYALTLTALQVAAFSLMCSAWCRTTVGAFLSTYFFGALFYFLPPLGYELVRVFIRAFIDSEFSSGFGQWCWCLCPVNLLESTFGLRSGIQSSNLAPSLLMQSVPAWISIVLFLGLSRFFLVRRAFLKGANPALLLFRWFDRCMQRLNRLAGNFTVGRSETCWPASITWCGSCCWWKSRPSTSDWQPMVQATTSRCWSLS